MVLPFSYSAGKQTNVPAFSHLQLYFIKTKKTTFPGEISLEKPQKESYSIVVVIAHNQSLSRIYNCTGISTLRRFLRWQPLPAFMKNI